MKLFDFFIVMMGVYSISCEEHYYHEQKSTLTNGAKAAVKAMAFKAWKNVGPMENSSNIIATITTLSTTIGSATICGKICLKTPNCCGFYYKHLEFCKLVNTSRRNETSVVKNGIHYYEIVSQCTKMKNICKSNQECVPDFINDSYSCKFLPSIKEMYHVETFENNTYLIAKKTIQMEWADAENNCVELGGHLTSLHSAEEDQFLHNALFVREYLFAWIGFNDFAVRGVYEWVDQTSNNFTNWYSYGNQKEPNGFHQNCVAYWDITTKPYDRGAWHDGPCTTKMPYICKVLP